MQQVIFQTVPEAATRSALVERDAADIAIEIPPNDFAAVAQRGAARAIAIPMRNHMDFIAMNSQAAPFNDVRVRQAIAYALPYEQIFQSVFRGRGVALYGGKPEAEPADLSAAERVQPRPGQGEGPAQGGGEGRRVSRRACSTAPARRPISTRSSLAVRDALGKIGIRVNIERLPGAQFDERTAARTAPMLLDNRVAWLSLPDYWFTAFYTGSQVSNLGNYANPEARPDAQGLAGRCPAAGLCARRPRR